MSLPEYLDACGIPRSSLPKIAGTYEGRKLVIVGDAIGVWDDLEAFGCRDDSGDGRVAKQGWDFMTVNKAVETFPGDIEHAYSNSADCLLRFIPARRDEYKLEFRGPTHTHAVSPGVPHHWPFAGHGTSGLGAVLVGLALGYAQIVLCGVPLDDGPHNGEPHWRKTSIGSRETANSGTSGWNRFWRNAANMAFEGKVKSMSGRTKEWLGGP